MPKVMEEVLSIMYNHFYLNKGATICGIDSTSGQMTSKEMESHTVSIGLHSSLIFIGCRNLHANEPFYHIS